MIGMTEHDIAIVAAAEALVDKYPFHALELTEKLCVAVREKQRAATGEKVSAINVGGVDIKVYGHDAIPEGDAYAIVPCPRNSDGTIANPAICADHNLGIHSAVKIVGMTDVGRQYADTAKDRAEEDYKREVY